VDGDQSRADAAAPSPLASWVERDGVAAASGGDDVSTFGLELTVGGALIVDEAASTAVRGLPRRALGRQWWHPGLTIGNVAGTRRNGGSYAARRLRRRTAEHREPGLRRLPQPRAAAASVSGAGGSGGGLIRIAADSIMSRRRDRRGDGQGATGGGGAIRPTSHVAGTGGIMPMAAPATSSTRPAVARRHLLRRCAVRPRDKGQRCAGSRPGSAGLIGLPAQTQRRTGTVAHPRLPTARRDRPIPDIR
jgi:hypothetical protein